MKTSGLAFGLLSATFYLLWTPSSGLKILHLGSCVIVTNLQEIQSEFSEIRDSVPSDRCCLLRHLLRLYLDRVFKNYQTSDYHTLRKLSSLANSFLTMKKDLQLCHAYMTCHCGEEATEKYRQILSHFEQLEPQAAAVKVLGELDILLRWMDEAE
ncbi:interleukin-20 isoform X2 [Heterocephalus glaber]|uniref:Interleukin family protein n=1 Tax=Heterocephalus glaber TaxID=10181 RepID=A0AAX6RQ44_HETGA|nr:interleukin-20 isoform X2 [Heterocephalus glaber]